MVPEKLRRPLAGALLLAVVAGLALGLARCPFWAAGAPCPTCGLSRATRALLRGDLGQAFEWSPLFPYWLAIVGGALGGVALHVVGLASTPHAVGKALLDRIPLWLHATALLVAEAWALWHLGLNRSGWVWALLRAAGILPTP